MGTIMERNPADSASPDSANLHDTANLMDHAVQHSPSLLSPNAAAVFSYGNTPLSHYQQPTGTLEAAFRQTGMNSRPSQGQLSSHGSNGLVRGSSGDGLLAGHASGDYSDRFHEAPVVEVVRKNSGTRQHSGPVDAGFWAVSLPTFSVRALL